MIRVVHLGLGEIGKGTIRAIFAQPRFLKLTAVVDPVFAGKKLPELFPGEKGIPAMRITGTLTEALKNHSVEVATMTTGSRTVQVRDTLEELIHAGVHVASTCEELSYPKLRAARLAAGLDKLARKHGVAIIGTGVNPGFAMDGFALACTAPCARVRAIKVVRSLDAGKRRQQLQKKVGAGMSVTDVNQLIKKNAIGHVGLGESCAIIAEGLGWKLTAIREQFSPVVAERAVISAHFQVKPGEVRGMRMTAAGIVGTKKLIELDLTMALDAETFDEVTIDGDPPLVVRATTGFPGDASTAGIVVNCARIVASLEPGMRTMLDLFKARSVGI